MSMTCATSRETSSEAHEDDKDAGMISDSSNSPGCLVQDLVLPCMQRRDNVEVDASSRTDIDFSEFDYDGLSTGVPHCTFGTSQDSDVSASSLSSSFFVRYLSVSDRMPCLLTDIHKCDRARSVMSASLNANTGLHPGFMMAVMHPCELPTRKNRYSWSITLIQWLHTTSLLFLTQRVSFGCRKKMTFRMLIWTTCSINCLMI